MASLKCELHNLELKELWNCVEHASNMQDRALLCEMHQIYTRIAEYSRDLPSNWHRIRDIYTKKIKYVESGEKLAKIEAKIQEIRKAANTDNDLA